MRILISDDHVTARIGLKQILNQEFGPVDFYETSSAAEVINLSGEKNFDLIILDISLPGRNGLEVLRQLHDFKIKTPVLATSFHRDDHFAVRVLKTGAMGFLSKVADGPEIINAVRQVLNGRKYITMSVAELLARHLNGDNDLLPHEVLSDREYETLIMIGDGKTVSQIARDLSLAVPTVSTYRSRILEKMQMNTNAELMRYVIEKNLI